MFKTKTVMVCCKLCVLGLLLFCLAFSTQPTSSQTCADNDFDNTTTCEGDCNDFDASKHLEDYDGDGITTCAYDCDDLDASVNNCSEQFREEPNYTYYPEVCTYTYMRMTRRYCPWGGGPPPPGRSFSECTIILVTDYLVEDRCN